ncbi:MAG: sulfurtransferase FdhD [Halobacteriovorax sp.]|nr:sulfurtransferase FdhD [Halobacteriovorax sp.]|tara:strand:+ start:145926 stop:146810 length:885 start_codon:yes stop_codon:yes gene_type:complete
MTETSEQSILRLSGSKPISLVDQVAVEEPLEIRLRYFKERGMHYSPVEKTISITMRTPGADFDLSLGFLFTEGIIYSLDDIEEVAHCPGGKGNIVKVSLKKGVKVNMPTLDRHFYTSSSCGVCGKTSIEALKSQNPYIDNIQSTLEISQEFLYKLPKTLREAQRLFEKTGGLHGCALFDISGELTHVREDVGRHNALDKLVGACLRERLELPLKSKVLLLSGRASFELIQKAAMAGISVIGAIGAPSSLAIELAKNCNITLVGFLRAGKMNVYSGSDRVRIYEMENPGREAGRH